MCGISAVVGDLAVLRAARISSYQSSRGTSSTGVAWPVSGHIEIMKNLLPPTPFFDKHKTEFKAIQVHTALGHNRLPSVGEISHNNAHPFMACSGDFALVHNGTGTIPKKWIQNLANMGHKFVGETDSEVMTHAIEECLKLDHGDWVKALRHFYQSFNGVEGFAILCMTKEGVIWGIRNYYPIKIAQTENEVLVASCLDGLEELNGKKVKAFEPQKGTVFQILPSGDINFWGKYDKEEATLKIEKHAYSEFSGYEYYNSQGWQNWSQRQKVELPKVKHTEQEIDALMQEWMDANNKGHAYKKKYQYKPGKTSLEELWRQEKEDDSRDSVDDMSTDIDEGAGYVYHEATSHFDRMRKCNLCHKAFMPDKGHYCKGGWESKPTHKGTFSCPNGTYHIDCHLDGCECQCHQTASWNDFD